MPPVLQGTFIYVQTHGRRQKDVRREVDVIRRSGGVALSDPLSRRITHMLVKVPDYVQGSLVDYCHVLDRSTFDTPKGSPEQQGAWPFERLVEVFTLHKSYPEHVKVVQSRWLQESIHARKLLEESDNWGGWLVR